MGTCENCRFSAPLRSAYIVDGLKRHLHCRRRAPRHSDGFPTVLRDDFCGEYESSDAQNEVGRVTRLLPASGAATNEGD